MKRDRFVFRGVAVIDNRKPRIVLQVHGDCGHCCEEEIIIFQGLLERCRSDKVYRAFREENAIAMVGAAVSSHFRKKFVEELRIFRRTFDSNNLGGDLVGVTTVANPRAINFKVRKNRDEVIAVRHCFELGLFQVRGEENGSGSVDINHRKLRMKFVAKVGEVGEDWVNFCEVSDSYRAIRAEAIGFDEDVRLLYPCEEVVVFAAELNVAEAAVAQHVASDAHVCLILIIVPHGGHFEELLKCFLTGR